jgi:hypothetical protein
MVRLLRSRAPTPVDQNIVALLEATAEHETSQEVNELAPVISYLRTNNLEGCA